MSGVTKRDKLYFVIIKNVFGFRHDYIAVFLHDDPAVEILQCRVKVYICVISRIDFSAVSPLHVVRVRNKKGVDVCSWVIFCDLHILLDGICKFIRNKVLVFSEVPADFVSSSFCCPFDYAFPERQLPSAACLMQAVSWRNDKLLWPGRNDSCYLPPEIYRVVERLFMLIGAITPEVVQYLLKQEIALEGGKASSAIVRRFGKHLLVIQCFKFI